MRNVSTFGSFTTARLGIYAAQKGLEVTGNNMTNINTTGYTRQRLDQMSFVSGGPDYYAVPMGTKVGNGVITTGVSQLRDPFLDIAYRNANTNVGQADTKLAWLEQVAGVLDEVGKGSDDNGLLYKQMQDVIDAVNQMITEGAGHKEYDALVRTAAQGLTDLFNTYAKGLEQKKENLETSLKQDVETVNGLLKNIQELNDSIRKADVRGDSALELRDQRNLALDELSNYMKIDVSYEMEDVGSGTMVEKLVVSISDTNIKLVDGKYVTQASVVGDNYEIQLSELEDRFNNKLPQGQIAQGLGEVLQGSLQASRDMLNGKGEFSSTDDLKRDPKSTTKRGIPYYQKSLDLLANKFAQVMNDANRPTDKSDPAGQNKLGGILFSNSSDGNEIDNITAANISISKNWSTGATQLQCSADSKAPASATDNLAHILAELTGKGHAFKPGAVQQNPAPDDPDTPLFTGSFQDMFLNIQGVLGNDIKNTAVVLNSYATTLDEVYVDRDSISGVDLNEEATNMMQYQKAYSAACRLMTTLDQALDKLINGTGVVGL